MMYSRPFLTALAESLKKQGVGDGEIDYYIKKFTESADINSNTGSMTYSEIDELASRLVEENGCYLHKNPEREEELLDDELRFPDFSSEEASDILESDSDEASKTEGTNINSKNIVRVDLEKKKKSSVKASPVFILLLILTMPITLPCALALCSLLGILYVLVTVLIVLSVLCLICVIASGIAVSLVGVIYGIIKIASSIPIALIELGVGISTAGLTMLFSILIYNLCVKLSPRLYSKAALLSKKCLCLIVKMYNYFKEECAK
ncbi:MAG: hypothetical protein PUB34_04625 [Clostridia bacterium]|nr:hypothetical protein [Clostridia bacterium]